WSLRSGRGGWLPPILSQTLPPHIRPMLPSRRWDALWFRAAGLPEDCVHLGSPRPHPESIPPFPSSPPRPVRASSRYLDPHRTEPGRAVPLIRDADGRAGCLMQPRGRRVILKNRQTDNRETLGHGTMTRHIRIETDTMGGIEVPADRLWGA